MKRLLEIVTYPDKVLTLKAKKVKEITLEIINLVKDMFEALKFYHGLGLAAPQVGASVCVIVFDLKKKNKDGLEIADPKVMINPEITWSSEEFNIYEEGCLSLPGISADVKRPLEVKVKWQDIKGKEFEKKFDGLAATMLQHEIDHLNGVLYIDRLSRLKKNMMVKKYNKNFEAEKKEA